MVSLKEKIVSLKDKLLANKPLLFAFLLLLFILLGVALFLVLKPEPPEVPPVPTGSLGQGLVSYWAFDEKGGQIVYDAKGGLHNGRLGWSKRADPADPQRFKKGALIRALKFDGKDDYVIVQDHPELRISKEITLTGWLKVLGPALTSPEPVWLPGFQYQRQVIIDNLESQQSFEDFQLLITLDTASLISQGKMQPNCQDLRFTDFDQTTPLPYWIETGCNTKETKVWVKIPHLSARSTKNIFFYYGNSQANSESNFYQTMESAPVQWWQYPGEVENWQGKEIKALAVSKEDDIVAVGADRQKGNLQWHYEKISPRGFEKEVKTENPSPLDDEINNAIFDLKGKLITVGYDFSPGNSQWRAEKEGGFTFTSNFSPGPDEIKAVAVDSENNVLLAGYDSEPGDAEWRLVKLNQDGEKLWEYSINPSKQADVAVDVKVDSQDNIILAGYEKALGNDRWRIEKLDPKGELLYSYRLDVSDGADVLNAIALDSKDNVIGVGYDFFPGDAQWRILKLDQEGKRVWQWNFNPSAGFDELRGVGVDSEDNIIVAGYDSEKGPFAWRILKFSSDGEKIWERPYDPSPGYDELKDMEIDSGNNVILGGYNMSLKKEPHWWVTKFSERKPVFPQPQISLQPEKVKKVFSHNVILAKAGSYQILATPDRITGFINQSPISSPLRGEGWYHFALTYDGRQQKLYLNGQLVNSKALTGEIKTNRNNLFIGYNFSGLIDELRIYNRALSPEEVRFLSKR